MTPAYGMLWLKGYMPPVGTHIRVICTLNIEKKELVIYMWKDNMNFQDYVNQAWFYCEDFTRYGRTSLWCYKNSPWTKWNGLIWPKKYLIAPSMGIGSRSKVAMDSSFTWLLFIMLLKCLIIQISGYKVRGATCFFYSIEEQLVHYKIIKTQILFTPNKY